MGVGPGTKSVPTLPPCTRLSAIKVLLELETTTDQQHLTSAVTQLLEMLKLTIKCHGANSSIISCKYET